MAMEQRQTEIREGAGLQESRINAEFVELLKKFSTPILVIVAILAGGYWFYNKQKESRLRAIDESFTQLDSAIASRSITSLAGVAADATPAASAGLLARLTSADMHLQAYRTSIPVGTEVDGMGNLIGEGAAFLTAEQRDGELKAAEEQYQIVLSQTQSDAGKLPLTLSSLTGLAAVAESRGQLDVAKSHYDSIIAKARAAFMDPLVKVMEARVKSLDQLKQPGRLYTASELASSTQPAVPMTTPLQNIQMRDAQGNPINLTPSAPPPGTVPPATPAPSTPAPTTPSSPAPAAEPAPATTTPPEQETPAAPAAPAETPKPN